MGLVAMEAIVSLNEKSNNLLIDGKWVEPVSGRSFETVNPATGDILANVSDGGIEDINRAVQAARNAFEGPWSRMRPYDRQRLLLRFADLVEARYDELSKIMTLDMGMPITRARRTIGWVLPMIHYYAGMARALNGETIQNSLPQEIFSYTLKEPVGVVGSITAWNGPLGSTVWKMMPVLATGCTMVLKPSEQAPLTALRLAELVQEAGCPAGVVNVVTGRGPTGAALASHPGVDKVAFTGSYETGKKIVEASAGNLKRVSLELGGKSPNIVFADADLNAAARAASTAVFDNSGQICCAGTRLFVHRNVHDHFTGEVVKYGASLKIGNGLDPSTEIGPLVSEQQLNRVQKYLDAGVQEGAKLVSGGNRMTGSEFEKGYFIPPTVFTNVKDDMKIAREEIFGPVLSVFPFEDVDEVIQRANRTMFGLAAGVWTNNVSIAHRLAKCIRAGTVWVNCYDEEDSAVPFGGYKMSGYGRESGSQHFDEYLSVKSVLMKIAD
jgi:aldehyde dehydrogenase (NAD+)